MDVLRIENLSHSYDGKVNVLNDINLVIEEGKSYAIIGKSGSGKSTFISLTAGLEKNSQGTIYYMGQDLKNIKLDDYRAREIGIIFQQYNLINNYSVADNILINMDIAGMSTDMNLVYELLEKVGLNKEYADKKPLELSGGEQQRVAIARALSTNPSLIIADEPTGNLDEGTEEEIMNLLINLVKEEDKTLIVVTHSNYVAGMADHVIGIAEGTINWIR